MTRSALRFVPFVALAMLAGGMTRDTSGEGGGGAASLEDDDLNAIADMNTAPERYGGESDPAGTLAEYHDWQACRDAMDPYWDRCGQDYGDQCPGHRQDHLGAMGSCLDQMDGHCRDWWSGDDDMMDDDDSGA